MYPILAFDRESVRSYDKDGHLHVARANISKACVNGYLGREIPNHQELGLDPDKIYNLYRDPAELEKAASTAAGKPILIRHTPITAGDHPAEKVVGAIGSDVEWKAPYLTADLTFWPKNAIDLIESGKQRQLSLGYRYRPDMTPGKVGDEAYQGIMREIFVNHLAIVEDGRAGPDVVVGDSKENVNMKDRNIAAKKARFVADALAMAQDGKFDALKDFLDAFGPDEDAAEAKPDESPTPVAPLKAGEPREPDEDAEDAEADADPVAKVQAFLKGKLSDEDMKQLDALVAAIGKAGEEHEQEEEAPVSTDPAMKAEEPAKDEDPDPEHKEEPVDKTAMDAAINAAVNRERLAAKELRETEKFVRPYVGELSVVYDSAESILRATAKALKVPDAEKVHPSALRSLITLAGAKPARAPLALVAMDAAEADSFAKRFPNADRLKK